VYDVRPLIFIYMDIIRAGYSAELASTTYFKFSKVFVAKIHHFFSGQKPCNNLGYPCVL
jgi:hypothetical protein